MSKVKMWERYDCSKDVGIKSKRRSKDRPRTSEHVNGHLAVKFYGINFSACFCDLSLQCNFWSFNFGVTRVSMTLRSQHYSSCFDL
jgi:hypothetical protein